MKRILVLGAGGAASLNFTRSLKNSGEPFYFVGTDLKYYVARAETDIAYVVPRAVESTYIPSLQRLIKHEQIDFVHAQSDPEVYQISKHRNELGTTTFLPSHRTVEICQDKFKSYTVWKKAGLPVPETILVDNPKTLRKFFDKYRHVWVRNIHGAGGQDSLPTSSYGLAKEWISYHEGWGDAEYRRVKYRRGWGTFTAAKQLTETSVTWSSIWKNGELIVAQGRKRLAWAFSMLTVSHITGLTSLGITVTDPIVDEIAEKSIRAVDKKPNGIYSVDLTYDETGVPNLTEINCGRFFTTHGFFTEAGLNMPYLYTKLAFNEPVDLPIHRKNPLPSGLMWVRGMDVEPKLLSSELVENWRIA